MKSKSARPAVVPVKLLFPFLLLSSCFLWWGLANNMTDPLIKVFKAVFRELSTFEASLIQFAFYFGYFCMAIPGAVIARKFSYKTGVLVGLGLYAAGCLLLYPSTLANQFIFFCLSFYVLACGLGILETNANPYVLAMGPEETATRRLNLAQAFNPIGNIVGVLVCQNLILAKLDQVEGTIVISNGGETDALNVVIFPYLSVAACLVVVWILIALVKMPRMSEHDHKAHFSETVRRLVKSPNYTFSVVAQFFYVGAQIAVWTFTVFYIPSQIEVTSETALDYHIAALILFALARWIFTALMKKVNPAHLLLIASVSAALLAFVVVTVGGIVGVIALVGISVFMSLMFPTIFGLGCEGLKEDTKLGASGLIMAILGGALLTPLQGFMIDSFGSRTSYLMPFGCFIVVALYALFVLKRQKNQT